MSKEMEKDIDDFFTSTKYESESNCKHRLEMLLKKYSGATSGIQKIDGKDLFAIIGSAKQKYANENVVIFLGQEKKKVAPEDVANMFVVEATIGHLNKIGCLKRLVKFDKREDRYEED